LPPDKGVFVERVRVFYDNDASQNLQKTIGFSLYNNRDFPFEFFKKVRIFAIEIKKQV